MIGLSRRCHRGEARHEWIAGRGRLEGRGLGVTETASSETDYMRDSGPCNNFGIAQLSETA